MRPSSAATVGSNASGNDRPSRPALAQPLRPHRLENVLAPRDRRQRIRTRPGIKRQAAYRHHYSPCKLFAWPSPSSQISPLRPRDRNRNRHARPTLRRSSRRWRCRERPARAPCRRLQNVRATRSTAGGKRSRASCPGTDARPTSVPSSQLQVTCATPARRRRFCISPCSSKHPIELYLIGNACRFRRCPNLKITFSAASVVAA